MLDNDILEVFRGRADAVGTGYQTLINAELKAAAERLAGKDSERLTVERLRQIIREELRAA